MQSNSTATCGALKGAAAICFSSRGKIKIEEAEPIGIAKRASHHESRPSPINRGLRGPAPIDANDVRVIDGDTIRVHHQKPDVRLVGFNAPETRRAQCDVERALGDRATARVRDLM